MATKEASRINIEIPIPDTLPEKIRVSCKIFGVNKLEKIRVTNDAPINNVVMALLRFSDSNKSRYKKIKQAKTGTMKSMGKVKITKIALAAPKKILRKLFPYKSSGVKAKSRSTTSTEGRKPFSIEFSNIRLERQRSPTDAISTFLNCVSGLTTSFKIDAARIPIKHITISQNLE
jgi:hypothetical protein